MSDAAISEDIALRIGLAARALPDTSPARLLKVLDDAIGLPPTKKKLIALKPTQLRSAADGEFADVDAAVLEQAVDILRGKLGPAGKQLPATQPYHEGDMPDSIRIACASNRDEQLDGHFGSCSQFLIYQVSKEEVRLIAVRTVGAADEEEDKNVYRAGLINDCQVLFVVSIGGPAAAKVVRSNIHPIKYPNGGPARDRMVELQAVLSDAPPPWLAKVMGHDAASRIRFEQEEDESV